MVIHISMHVTVYMKTTLISNAKLIIIKDENLNKQDPSNYQTTRLYKENNDKNPTYSNSINVYIHSNTLCMCREHEAFFSLDSFLNFRRK